MSNTTENLTNIIANFSTDVEHENDKFLVSALYMSLSVFGLILEILVLYIVFKLNGLRLSSFNTFLVCVMSTEIAAFLLYFLYAAPCILAEKQIYGYTVGEILGNFETVDFLALVGTTFFISLNRAMSLSGSHLYHRIFRRNYCLAYCISAWIFASVAVSIDIALKCRTVFLEKQFYFTEQCVGQPPALTATSLTIYLGVYCVAIMYGYSLWKLFKQHKQMSSDNRQLHGNMNKRKRMLFYQALCIWVTLFINVISFRVIPEFLEGLPAVLLTAFIILGTNFISPVCMLIFSGDIRRAAVNIILLRPFNDGNVGVNRNPTASRTTKAPVSFGMNMTKITPVEE